jgi:hypothetical protein
METFITIVTIVGLVVAFVAASVALGAETRDGFTDRSLRTPLC